jgi:8-oxo-dGTP pyrophosphatase MutT (NUDIX family)
LPRDELLDGLRGSAGDFLVRGGHEDETRLSHRPPPFVIHTSCSGHTPATSRPELEGAGKFAGMGIAPHIARLRAFVGHEQLLLPCATVLPLDERGRVLLAWAAGHSDGWGTVGGAVDPGESPAEAAIREAREETGVEIRLIRLVDVLGGPDYEVTYPNGDRAAYVTAVYEASVIDGVPAPADGELSDVAWFTREELASIPLSRFTRALLTATGYLPTA